MNFSLTAHGRVVDFATPIDSAATLPVDTIAHSLAQVNRFTGHAARPYSVAEHSLLVAEILEQELHSPFVVLAGLLHDAHECITNDQATPSKAAIAGWKQFEGQWESAFHSAFGLRQVFMQHAAAIHHADLVAMATERRDLLPPAGPEWTVLHGIQPLPWLNLRSRDGFSWADWRQAFIDRYHELQFACALRHQGHATA